MPETEPFVLDKSDNPHPKMLAAALAARAAASESAMTTWVSKTSYWHGYLAAMADATGCTPAELEAWMDSHG